MPRNRRRDGDTESPPGFTHIDEARDLMREVHMRAGDAELDEQDQAEWDRAEAFVRASEEAQENLRDLHARGSYERAGESRAGRREENTPYERARRTLDSYRTDELPDDARHKITAAFDTSQGADREGLARYTELVGSKDYLNAFLRVLVDPAGGHRNWTPEELRAWQAVSRSQRALGVGAAGDGAAAAVPLILDPAVILTNDGTVNPVRQLASVRSIFGNRWQGITSEGVTADWTLEATEVDETSLAFEPPAITTRKYTAFVPYSFEIEGDWSNLTNELRKIFADAVEAQQAQAFAIGTGPADGEFAQPEGLVTGLDGTASQLFAGGGFDRDDLLAMRYAVPPRFRANASVLSSLEVQDMAREFPAIEGSTGDVSLVTEGSPPAFRGWKWYEYSALDADPTQGGANFLVAGDFRGYQIVDRVGSTIELVPHVFSSAHNRPTGQRGALLWGRVGAGVVNPNALRLLSNGSS